MHLSSSKPYKFRIQHPVASVWLAGRRLSITVNSAADHSHQQSAVTESTAQTERETTEDTRQQLQASRGIGQQSQALSSASGRFMRIGLFGSADWDRGRRAFVAKGDSKRGAEYQSSDRIGPGTIRLLTPLPFDCIPVILSCATRPCRMTMSSLWPMRRCHKVIARWTRV